MTQRIYKFTIGERVALPKGAVILSAIIQNGRFQLYAMVNPREEETETYQVVVAGTGQGLPEGISTDYTFLGTVTEHNAALVWHIFYKKETN